jgi:hypothetical protein
VVVLVAVVLASLEGQGQVALELLVKVIMVELATAQALIALVAAVEQGLWVQMHRPPPAVTVEQE